MTIWFCDMDVNCPKSWDELKLTSDPLIRNCSDCGKPVHFIDSQEELRKAAEAGQCVAFYKYAHEEIPLRDRFELRRLYVSTKPIREEFMTLGVPSSGNGSSERFKSFIDLMNDDENKNSENS